MVEDAARNAAPGWVQGVRWLLLVGIWLFLAGILLQALLAGRGLFGADSLEAHVGTGYLVGHMLAPLLLVVSLAARLGWRLHVLVALGFVLGVLMPILALARDDAPEVAALHPVTAVVLFALVLWVERDVRRLTRTPGQAALAP